MQLTTIVALLISCLVLFASVSYTDSSSVQGKYSIIHPNPSIRSRGNRAIGSRSQLENGHRRFAGQQILDSIRQRRQR